MMAVLSALIFDTIMEDRDRLHRVAAETAELLRVDSDRDR